MFVVWILKVFFSNFQLRLFWVNLTKTKKIFRKQMFVDESYVRILKIFFFKFSIATLWSLLCKIVQKSSSVIVYRCQESEDCWLSAKRAHLKRISTYKLIYNFARQYCTLRFPMLFAFVITFCVWKSIFPTLNCS